MVELLAPAGDMEALDAALTHGADAVYLGGPMLQLRADQVGFDREKLALAAQRVHRDGKKLYVTVNSFARNGELSDVGDYARFLSDVGADAVIVADLGVLREIKTAVPDLDVHVSTQANCQNYRTAEVYYDLGASRVVLAREMNLDEIRELCAKKPKDLGIEVFIHGAMCMAYSGRCLLSSYLTGRSGNRGECTHPCRWKYALMEEKRPGEYFPIDEDEKGTEILASHDLCMIDHLDELIAAGVDSFKIEGRMKTAYYVATVVNAYRRAMDGTASLDWCRKELDAIKHRPYETGFYYDHLRHNAATSEPDIQDYKFAARVLSCENGRMILQQRNPFSVGDELETLAVTGDTLRFTVTELYNEAGEAVSDASHPMEHMTVPTDLTLPEGTFLRKKVQHA